MKWWMALAFFLAGGLIGEASTQYRLERAEGFVTEAKEILDEVDKLAAELQRQLK